MDKVIIYGTFEFINFHLCKKFLEKGYDVTGVHFHQDNDPFLDEKRLEVGRNANFHEMELPELENNPGEDDSAPAIILISLYELFMSWKEAPSASGKRLEQLAESINNRKEMNNQLVYLLPVQLLSDGDLAEDIEELKTFLTETVQKGECLQYFYLPTIFGPWQPPSFLFQKVLLKELHVKTEETSIREWTGDAIFIHDALDLIVESIETGKKGSFMLDSGISDSWVRCADYLNVDQSLIKELQNLSIKNDDQIVKLAVKQVTPCRKSLMIQKEHLFRISGLKDQT